MFIISSIDYLQLFIASVWFFHSVSILQQLQQFFALYGRVWCSTWYDNIYRSQYFGRPVPNNRKYFLGYDTDYVRQVGRLKSQKITEDNHAFFTDLLGEKKNVQKSIFPIFQGLHCNWHICNYIIILRRVNIITTELLLAVSPLYAIPPKMV